MPPKRTVTALRGNGMRVAPVGVVHRHVAVGIVRIPLDNLPLASAYDVLHDGGDVVVGVGQVIKPIGALLLSTTRRLPCCTSKP